MEVAKATRGVEDLEASSKMTKEIGEQDATNASPTVPALYADLERIRKGLSVALEGGIKGVVVEIDSLNACQLIMKMEDNYPYRVIIKDSYFLLNSCKGMITHTKREGNQCADLLANLGVAQLNPFVLLRTPPREVCNALRADTFGGCFPRGS